MADIWKLPAVPEEDRPRRLYFAMLLSDEEESQLEGLGYEAVNLFSLPRRNHAEEVKYLLAKAQAYEEGTIPASQEDRHQLTLLMKAYGLLDTKKEQLNLNITATKRDLDTILGWKNSHHTLRNNTNILGIETRTDNPTSAHEERKPATKKEKPLKRKRRVTRKARGSKK